MPKRHAFLVALALALMLALVVGCGSSESSSKSDSGDGAAEEPGHIYETMPLDANAEATLAHMPDTVAEYVESFSTRDDAVEGETYLDVTGIGPSFIGYEVVVWEPKGDGSTNVDYVELPYINGHIAESLGNPESVQSSEPRIEWFDQLNTREMPASPSEGEQAAVDAAREFLAQYFDDAADMQYGIKRYLFLYAKDGQGVVIGQTLDGELSANGSPVRVAE